MTFGPSAHGDTPLPLRHADVLNGWSLVATSENGHTRFPRHHTEYVHHHTGFGHHDTGFGHYETEFGHHNANGEFDTKF